MGLLISSIIKITMFNKIKKWLWETLNIIPHNLSLYITALTHSSYRNEHHLDYDYEKLEFFGDAIIGFLISKYLFLKYKNENEGFLTQKKIQLIQAKTLVFLAKKIKLDNFLLLGKGIQKLSNIDKIIEDAFEALIAAIYLDQNMEICQKIVKKIFLLAAENTISPLTYDYKSFIQNKFINWNKVGKVKYLTKRLPNNLYRSSLWFNQIKYGEGFGMNKKTAEKQAAKSAYTKFVNWN